GPFLDYALGGPLVHFLTLIVNPFIGYPLFKFRCVHFSTFPNPGGQPCASYFITFCQTAAELTCLNIVFWKFSHRARCQDLPDYYPPMLSCRHYYRHLFLSGRLATLYSALYQDFLTHGKAYLDSYVKQGGFSITETSLLFAPVWTKPGRGAPPCSSSSRDFRFWVVSFMKKSRNGVADSHLFEYHP
ncbi:MAG: hypothetical protein NTW99_13980, partial [Chloroflexi bacterium]|nr:hypothetical protein [Chloroflexota bacterium]